mmetsp:Transcript_80944/g.174970  ORF Transcript_80944/g.174970 Transcript_80944/m.174970 type:complete len:178 (+) Transcript_80944:1-534(+)
MGLAASIAAMLPLQAVGSQMHIASLCKSQTCEDARYPIMDYAEGKCICRAHPCWDDNGNAHSCSEGKFPHLTFSYSKDKELTCSCSANPQYTTVHVNRDLCPGHYCEQEDMPILDYDKDGQKCICRAHPCWDLEGVKHSCDDPKFPILRYREEEVDGAHKTTCECVKKMEQPKADEL